MANVVRLTESELKRLISESVINYLIENEEDEGLWNQLKQGTKSFFGNGYGKDKETNFRNTVADRQQRGEHTANWMNGSTPLNLKGRWNAAKAGWKEQGRIDTNDETTKVLTNLVQKYGENKTLGQILKSLNMSSNGARGRISKANNDIYRGSTTGVMGSGKHQTV